MKRVSLPAAIAIMILAGVAARLAFGLIGVVRSWSVAQIAVGLAVTGGIAFAVLLTRRSSARSARRRRFESATSAAMRDLEDAEQTGWVTDLQARRATGAAGHAPAQPSWDPPSPPS